MWTSAVSLRSHHVITEKKDMFVEQILPQARERLATIDAAASVTEAAEVTTRLHADLVVVCNETGNMVGVITRTDIVSQIGLCGAGGCASRVDTIMTRDVLSSRTKESLEDVWTAMKARALRHVPVVEEDGKPIGILHARDVLQNLLGEVKNEETLLRDYVMNVGYR
jgi:CBS domain-containing protein